MILLHDTSTPFWENPIIWSAGLAFIAVIINIIFNFIWKKQEYKRSLTKDFFVNKMKGAESKINYWNLVIRSAKYKIEYYELLVKDIQEGANQFQIKENEKQADIALQEANEMYKKGIGNLYFDDDPLFLKKVAKLEKELAFLDSKEEWELSTSGIDYGDKIVYCEDRIKIFQKLIELYETDKERIKSEFDSLRKTLFKHLHNSNKHFNN